MKMAHTFPSTSQGLSPGQQALPSLPHSCTPLTRIMPGNRETLCTVAKTTSAACVVNHATQEQSHQAESLPKDGRWNSRCLADLPGAAEEFRVVAGVLRACAGGRRIGVFWGAAVLVQAPARSLLCSTYVQICTRMFVATLHRCLAHRLLAHLEGCLAQSLPGPGGAQANGSRILCCLLERQGRSREEHRTEVRAAWQRPAHKFS